MSSIANAHLFYGFLAGWLICHPHDPIAALSDRHHPSVDCGQFGGACTLDVRAEREGGIMRSAAVGYAPAQGVSDVFDRYDPRSIEPRERGDSVDRSRGARGANSDREPSSERDPRDVFTRDLDHPRGRKRELVRDRERVYEINGTESRLLATVGAFRVVAESDLHDGRDGQNETRRGVRHLEAEDLVRTSPLSSDDRAVVLTERGRELLEANRSARGERSHEPRQTFYAGLRKPRELTHDAKVYRAYQRAETRLREQGGRVNRVVLDYERNRGRADCDGRPDREPEEIARWAREHQLPCDGEHVHFPDARVEYRDEDGRSRYEDLEVVTGHYRGAHAGAAARSGFTCYRAGGGLVGGRGGGWSGPHPRLAEELI
jgi:hypothetical protein